MDLLATKPASRSLRSRSCPPPVSAAVAKAVAEAVHDERVRVRGWLHDQVLQMLDYIVAGGYEDDDAVDADRLRQVAATAAAEVRAYVEQPLPAPRSSLVAALTETVTDAQLLSGAVTVELVVGAMDCDVAPERVEALAAAVQEALTNVRKHARATSTVVTCSATAEGTIVEVADDGVGFELGAVHARTGLRHGIVGRLVAGGGSATVVSSPDRGTLVTLSYEADPAGRAQNLAA